MHEVYVVPRQVIGRNRTSQFALASFVGRFVREVSNSFARSGRHGSDMNVPVEFCRDTIGFALLEDEHGLRNTDRLKVRSPFAMHDGASS